MDAWILQVFPNLNNASQYCQDGGEIPGPPGLSSPALLVIPFPALCVHNSYTVAFKSACLVDALVSPFIWGSTHQYPKAIMALERGDLCW